MDFDAISRESVREALRALLYARSLQDNPLLGMQALSAALRRDGVSTTDDALAWQLGQLLERLSREALRDLAGAGLVDADAPVTPALALERLRRTFRQSRPDLEAWSILYFRYFVPSRMQLEDVATELGMVYRTLARRLDRGHALLADRLRAHERDVRRELDVVDGAPAPAAPGDASPAEADGGEPERRFQRVPRPANRLIGRRAALQAVTSLVRSERLVTITGAAGIGKTRLAIEAGHALGDTFAGGVVWCALVATSDAELVALAIAEALGVVDLKGDDAVEAIATALAGQSVLLVLDNCEHVVAACAQLVDALLEACPRLHCLTTSREPLHIPGERSWPLRPLTTRTDAEEGEELEATALFVARARDADPAFAPSATDVAVIEAICVRLDGIPLAIELAAARTPLLSVADIAERLEDRFRLLTRGNRTATPQHRTLHDAIDWGHDLLGDEERILFRRLAVFHGWSLASAESVVPGAGLDEDMVLDVLGQLVDKSLVTVAWEAGARRYRMLETIRAYAMERLAEAGEEAALLDRHLHWALELADAAAAGLRGPEQGAWLGRLDAEQDNLRSALHTTGAARRSETWDGPGADQGEALSDIVAGLALAASLEPYWMARGLLAEGRAHLERLLGNPRAQEPTTERAAALMAAGAIARQQADYEAAARWLDACLAIQRAKGDLAGIAASLRNLGNVAEERGEQQEARTRYLESRACYEALGDRWGVAAVENNLGLLAYHRGEFTDARNHLELSAAGFGALGEAWAVGIARYNLAKLSLDEGDLDTAESLFTEGLAATRELADPIGVTGALGGLGHVALKRGDVVRARALFLERLATLSEVGDRQDQAEWLESMADVDRAAGEMERAVELLAAADALRAAIGAPLPPKERTVSVALRAELRDVLGQAAFDAAWARGGALSWATAVERARA